MKIALTGFMGSGKSTIGKLLAKKMAFDFVDLDKLIEEEHNLSIPQIFDKFGIEGFRKVETNCLKSLLTKSDNLLIALGGGCYTIEENIALLHNAGVKVVYLRLEASSLFNRLLNSGNDRPLIKNLSGEELKSFIDNLLAERTPFYERAHLTVDAINLKSSEGINSLMVKVNHLLAEEP